MSTKNPLAILVAPLKHLVGVHAVFPCDAGNRCARRKGRLDNTALFFRRTVDALRRFWLAHTLDDFAHSVIVGPGEAPVQTVVR